MGERKKIKITFESGISVICEIHFDENPKTAEALNESLTLPSKGGILGQRNLLRRRPSKQVHWKKPET
jgi:hypothetical protein